MRHASPSQSPTLTLRGQSLALWHNAKQGTVNPTLVPSPVCWQRLSRFGHLQKPAESHSRQPVLTTNA